MKKKKKSKIKLYKPGYQFGTDSVDSNSEQQATALTSGIGKVNPAIGAFLKIGQGIGKQTMTEDGIYKSKAGQFLDNSINPTTGITNLKDVAQNFSGKTLANQLSLGLLGESATQMRRKKELEQAYQQDNTLMLMHNAGQGMKNGGKLSSKLNVVSGGSLSPISEDAVEVKANNPAQTDSVELSQAFVDNNEIIDRKDRVFSDELFTPAGKTIAKEAKKLEKMKSESSRFKDSNDRIDSKLDELFNYQEDMKKKNSAKSYERLIKAGLVDGGYLRKGKPKLDDGGIVRKPKPKYDDGGPFTNQLDQPIVEDGFAGITEPKQSGFSNLMSNTDWGKVGNTAATVAPNIVNAFLQRKLKAPKSPTLETDTKLDRIDPSAQLAEASRQANMATKMITSNTAQGSNLTSATGSILAKRLSNNNQIYGQTNNMNAQIQNNEAYLNQGIRSRNTNRLNQFKDDKVDFANKKLQMTSENVANLSGKIQSQRRERNLMNLDKDKFAIIQARFEDLPAEMKAKYPTVFDYYNSEEYKDKNAFGGYLSRKTKKRNIKIK